ncbi:superoxide dismutase [Ihubacter sp. rT4E-8]|uniref:superoxide dismutase n=1 Tax=unclassified Ihubacter TaxID=2633299 RepID=UPI00137A95C4
MEENLKQHYPFVNPPLPYAYDALEPFIDEKTMKLHHDAHLQTYVDNLNDIISKYPSLHNWSLEQLIIGNNQLPWEIQEGVRNNAGGVYNHILYFSRLAPINETIPPSGNLLLLMEKRFGGFDAFKQEFKRAASTVFGSGYVWLVTDQNGQLQIVTTANQDNPLASGFHPIIALDLWEHAYYLKHYNKRADYIENWFHLLSF